MLSKFKSFFSPKGCLHGHSLDIVLFCNQNNMGYNSFLAQLGTSVAPLILLLGDGWRDLPHRDTVLYLLYWGAIVARKLSETHNRVLPETIEDTEKD